MVQLTIIAYSFQKISKREKKWTQFLWRCLKKWSCENRSPGKPQLCERGYHGGQWHECEWEDGHGEHGHGHDEHEHGHDEHGHGHGHVRSSAWGPLSRHGWPGRWVRQVHLGCPDPPPKRTPTESRKFTTKSPKLEILRYNAESNELCIRITINNSRFTVSAFIFLLQTEYLGTSHWEGTRPQSFW